MSHQALLSMTAQNRKVLNSLMKSLSLAELNEVPNGCNNNILWNVAHSVACAQSLIYRLGGVQYSLPKEFVKAFQPGTKPEGLYDQAMVDQVREYSKISMERLITDVESGAFATFTPYTTRTRYVIEDISSALTFNLYHEGMHAGYALNIKNLLGR